VRRALLPGARLASAAPESEAQDLAVVLAIVVPSVGRHRDIAGADGDGRLFVGPDNGLLAQAWRASDGVVDVVSVTSSEVVLEPLSPSFHARDVMAPAAARLASGRPLEDLRERASV
jgi:S-adenosyl-L-methionine hydrolase (adenosine-forming)